MTAIDAEVAAVNVATGTGLLARRAGALLFAPGGDAQPSVVEAFMEAVDPFAEIGDLLVAADFGVEPFALVDWAGGHVQLMVFGAVEVTTDQPALPLLSGAGSRTWVEHRVHRSVSTATIMVSPPSADDKTSLGHGVVPAGGFRLRWTRPAASAAPPEPEAAAADQRATVAVDRAAVAADAPASCAGQHDGPVAPADAAAPSPFAPAVDVVDPLQDVQPLDLPPTIDANERTAALNAIQAAALGAEVSPPPGKPAHPAPSRDAAWPPAESHGATEGATLVPPAHQTMGVVVQARPCSAGHLNSPASISCEACQALLPSGDETLIEAEQPVFRQLRFDDGRTIPVTGDLTLGRQSSPPFDPGFVPLSGEKVSRRHAAVLVRGWQLFIKDLDSRNGTTVMRAPDTAPLLLGAAHDPVPVDPGAVVMIDEHTFVVEAASYG